MKRHLLAVALTLSPNPSLLKKVGECKKGEGPSIALIKQWHLSPGVDTTHGTKESLPQTANLKEIYDQLSEWLSAKQLDTVIAEGCEGEMNASFKMPFNGWTYEKLSAASNSKTYNAIPTHVVLKLEAKYKEGVNSVCGDDVKAMKEEQIAFSDARGDIGFLTRLSQLQNDPQKSKIYLDGAKEVLKLKPDASLDDVLNALKKDLKDTLVRIKDANQKRNAKAVETLLHQQSAHPLALVFGGAHINDLKTLLEAKNRNCGIFEPVHYQNDEEKMQHDLEAAIGAL